MDAALQLDRESRKARGGLVAATLAAVVLGAASAAAAPVKHGSTVGLPKRCPSHSLVGKTLGLTLRTQVVTYTSATYQGGGPGSFRAMPAGPTPVKAIQKTCLYTYSNPQQSAAEGIVVPVTITFEYPVTQADFSASRHAAQHSVDPLTVRGLGDVAWVIKAPLGDPRGGNSLFVLKGTTEVVVGGPPRATVDRMSTLVRTFV